MDREWSVTPLFWMVMMMMTGNNWNLTPDSRALTMRTLKALTPYLGLKP